MGPHGIHEARALIFAAEYTALRAELMFFIQMQRQNMNFLLTTAFGQILGLALLGYEKVDPTLIIYFYLFAVPLLIGLLMLMSLENTAKVVMVASYIAESLRRQIRPLFDSDADYFLWEYHKRDTRRLNRRILTLLDRSKWLIFIVGLILSTCLAYLVQTKTHALTSGLIFSGPISVCSFTLLDQFVLGGLLVVLIIMLTLSSAKYFSEAEGEIARMSKLSTSTIDRTDPRPPNAVTTPEVPPDI